MSDASNNLRELLQVIVEELVDQPEEVNVTVTTSNGGKCTVLSVKTAPGEVGKVIGRSGRNAKSIRTIIDAAAAKYRTRVMLDIEDDTRR